MVIFWILNWLLALGIIGFFVGLFIIAGVLFGQLILLILMRTVGTRAFLWSLLLFTLVDVALFSLITIYISNLPIVQSFRSFFP